MRKVDENIDALVDTARYNTAKDPDNLDLGVLDALDEKLTEALSELRLLKDEWEIEQMKTRRRRDGARASRKSSRPCPAR